MSILDNFKLRLNTNIATLSQSDIRLMFKDLYEQVGQLQTEVLKLQNETRDLPKDRTKVDRVTRRDVPSTGV
jgi:hypothetical protein